MSLFTRKREPKPGHEVHPDFVANAGTHYLDVMDRLEAVLDPSLYLEIGARSGTSLARRKCSFVAVDPRFVITADVFNGAPQMLFFQQTSDDFFASGVLRDAALVPDLAFIDGMHLFEYALRDFINCERAMRPGGVICLHDVCPFNYAMTTRDLDYLEVLRRPWTGDVWKVMAALKDYRPDLTIELLSAAKTGLGVVSDLDPSNTVLNNRMDEILARYRDMDLAEIGARAYFSRFPLKDPEALSLWSRG